MSWIRFFANTPQFKGFTSKERIGPIHKRILLLRSAYFQPTQLWQVFHRNRGKVRKSAIPYFDASKLWTLGNYELSLFLSNSILLCERTHRITSHRSRETIISHHKFLQQGQLSHLHSLTRRSYTPPHHQSSQSLQPNCLKYLLFLPRNARHHHIFPPSRQLPRGTHDRSLSYGTARRNLFETVENLPGFWILKRHCVRGSGESRGTHIIGDEGKNAGVENLVGQRMGQGEPLGDEVAEMDPQGEQSQSDPGGIWRGIGRLAEELEEVVENLRETAGKEVRKWRDPSVGRRSEFPRRRGSWREGRGGPGRSGRRVRLRRR